MNDGCKRLTCTLIVLAFCPATSYRCYAQEPIARDAKPMLSPGAMIFANSCLPCHGADSPAAVDLSDPGNLLRRAPTAAKLVREGFMPPWLASDSGAPLAHSRKLSAQDRTALLEWLDHCAKHAILAPQKSAAVAAVAANSRELVACSESVRIADDWHIGADPGMQLRTFALVLHRQMPKYIGGIEMVGDAPGVVHSLSFLWDQRGYGLRLDASDPQPGYDAVGDIGLQASGAGGTISRLKNPWLLPAGYALEIIADAALVAEVHADARGKVESPAVTIRFIEAIEPFRILRAHSLSSVRPMRVAIPCDAVSIAIRAGSGVDSIQVIATQPGGPSRILLDIPRWNERFSEPWIFDPPVELSAETELTVRSTINPQVQNTPLDDHATLLNQPTVVILAADHLQPAAKTARAKAD